MHNFATIKVAPLLIKAHGGMTNFSSLLFGFNAMATKLWEELQIFSNIRINPILMVANIFTEISV